jgi:hypothetical protein
MKDFIGETVGQYRIDALLGTGGMGQVYRGVHRLLERPAAIKVMQAGFAARPDFRARFLQEAKAAAALHHPNIVEVYDYGDEQGVLYLVMELLSDGSLSGLLKRQSGRLLPLPLVLDLCSQVAQGLAAAHALQVVHRDIKPANLLLRRLPGAPPGREQYTIKITDFGLARLMEGGVETVTGAPMGTLAYMSPEQCLGSKQIDGRSDIYSLGVVIYEMVTGYLPFQINSITDAIYKHVNMSPPSPRQMRSDLPPVLEDIIMHCLAKRPEERFATGAALATALQGVLGNTGGGDAGVTAVQEQAALVTRTTFEAPGSTAMPAPPTISTMPGFSEVPRVRVIDESGRTLQVVEVRPTGITVGRQEGNDIVLVSQRVSRQHLRITWDGKQVKVQDLGSSNGTVLDGVRLLPQVSQVWQERQMIRLGSFWLRLEGASPMLTEAGPRPTPGPGQPQSLTEGARPTSVYANYSDYAAPTVPRSSPPSLANARIGLSVTPKTLSVTPGQSASVQLTLTNMGSIVDWFTPSVEGVPPEWVQGVGQEVQLNPGMQESLNLIVSVPRHPACRAGEYRVVIRARSREQPQEYSQTNGVWTVLPFKEEALSLEPRRASGRGRASYSLALHNGGNAPARYELRGDDDEQRLHYEFHANPVDLDAGQEARIPLKVRERRRLIGSEQRIPFQVRAGPPGGRPTQSVPAEFVNKALLPRWIVPAALAVVLVAGGALAFAAGLLHPPGGNVVATPTPNIAATITALSNQGANTATVQAVSAQATAAAQATATAQANTGAQTTATAQANATATAQANATATALANIPPPVASSTTSIATGLQAPIGEQYVAAQDALYFVEYSGRLSVLRNVNSSPSYTVLGTGYSQLEDLYVLSDGHTVYLTERAGFLDRVDLNVGGSRSQATIVASGLLAPQQLVVDEQNHVAYVADYNDNAPTGDVVKVDLNSGTVSGVISGIPHPIGILLSPDRQTLYVTEQRSDGSGVLVRYSLTAPGSGTALAQSQGAPLFFMHWANSQGTALLVTERSPTNKVWYLNLNKLSEGFHLVASVGSAPSDVVISGQQGFFPMLVCVAGLGEIDQLNG